MKYGIGLITFDPKYPIAKETDNAYLIKLINGKQVQLLKSEFDPSNKTTVAITCCCSKAFEYIAFKQSVIKNKECPNCKKRISLVKIVSTENQWKILDLQKTTEELYFTIGTQATQIVEFQERIEILTSKIFYQDTQLTSFNNKLEKLETKATCITAPPPNETASFAKDSKDDVTIIDNNS